MLLLIDNYDSFTFNLARYFMELGQQVVVERNDALTLEDIESMAPEYLVLSPGPCTPDESGITLDVIEAFAGKIPLLGVCLGYQAIGQVFGADVVRAKAVMHGKTSLVKHNGHPMFSQVSSPFTATRYHSLVIDESSLPQEFEVTAWCEDESGQKQEIMAIAHKTLPVSGVQFHPESVLTVDGHQILKNFIQGQSVGL